MTDRKTQPALLILGRGIGEAENELVNAGFLPEVR